MQDGCHPLTQIKHTFENSLCREKPGKITAEITIRNTNKTN